MPIVTQAQLIKTSASQGGGNVEVSLDAAPNKCPVCHVTIDPEFLSGNPYVAGLDWLETYYRCTNMNCRRHFTAFYRFKSQSGPRRNYEFERCNPVVPQAQNFDAAISALSPKFIEVYGQASAAEGHGLTEVAGPGFRKALEFLVKDYAIHLNPQHADVIKQRQLASVIKEFLPGDRLQVVSSRAAWLGNDQTHYESRWIGKDLQDLKKLIDATAHFVAMEQLVADLPVDMPPTGPPAPINTP